MTHVGMAEQSDERRHQFETEALRIVNTAADKGLSLRLLGSLAFQFHCPNFGYLQKQLGRAYTDIDYAGYKEQASKMTSFFVELGYQEDPEVNLLYAGERMIFTNNALVIHVDIFFDKIENLRNIFDVSDKKLIVLTHKKLWNLYKNKFKYLKFEKIFLGIA